jgi:gamma-glutamyltranspeptidase/glutathione hydrolase
MGIGKQKIGDIMTNENLAKTMRYMVEAERKALANGGTRSDGIWAARDAFYKGEPARAVDEFFEEHAHGIMTYEDLASYRNEWMRPVHTKILDYDVYGCDGWSQGPRMILMINMLKEFGLDKLESLGYNTPEYIHVLSQIINLAMSDAHRYIGDPTKTDIPRELYSQEYARERIKLIDMNKAFEDMPPWGDPRRMKNIADDSPTSFIALNDSPLMEVAMADNASTMYDTSSLNVMDAEGNIFSMTESDTHQNTPIMPGWGFGLGARAAQFNMDPTLNNVVAPHKIPRNTNNPWLALKDGKPFMGFSTPGGDQQAQALFQVFLNVILWGMEPQAAIDQPRFGSYNFPGTGSETNSSPGVIRLESRIPEETFKALEELGHQVDSWGMWNYRSCAPTVTYRDPETGILIAATDVRRETFALGY